MNLGVANAILISQLAAFKGAATQNKITPVGSLAAILENSVPNVISKSKDDGSGYIRDVKIRGRKRMPSGLTNTSDDCIVNSEPDHFEQTIPSLSTRSYGVFYEFDTIETYTENALALTRGAGSIQMAQEFVDGIMSKMNGLIADINADIFTAIASNFGTHAASGSNAVRTVNFPLAATNNNLAQGITQLMTDMALNETMWNQLKVCGAGLSFAYWMQHMQNMVSANQSGINTAAVTHPKYYFDPYAPTALGAANEFVVMDKDAVQFLNVCKFRGYKGMIKGDSEFGTMPVSLTDSLGNPLRNLELDVQVKYNTCPSDIEILEDAAYPSAVSKGRGVSIFLIARFAPVFQSASAFVSTDRLYQNNGVWNYLATNA